MSRDATRVSAEPALEQSNRTSTTADSAGAVARGVRNQVAFLKHVATNASGGQIVEDERYLLFAGGHDYPGPYINGAIRKTSAISPAELFARADAFFGSLGRQYIVWVLSPGEADLGAEAARRGLWPRPPVDGNECICRLEPLEPAPALPGFRIRRAGSDEELAAYIDLVARSYGLEGGDPALLEAVLISRASLRTLEIGVFLGQDVRSGDDVAGFCVYLAHECAGLQWLVTDPAVRGRGYGREIMRHGMAWSFERGARSAWGVASQQGAPIWRGMGFGVPVRYQRYLATAHLQRPISAPDLPLDRLG
jgi:GNAT superfamily N-acetyltransferase